MDKVGYKDILHQKEYMKTVIADIINRLGDSIDTIAFVWLVYQVTGSAAWSALIFGINKIPTVFLQPFAGALVEGAKKKRIMVITDIIRGLCVGFIATAYLMGFLNQWYLLATTLIISSAEAFRGPASSALIPKLLEQKYYEFGLSLSRSTSSIMEMIGLSVAGVIVARFSVATAIYIDMATFFISAFILSLLRIKENALSKSKIHPKEYINTLKEGFTYLNQNTFLKYFVVLALFLNAILVPFNSLLAPLISEVLHSGEVMMSILSAALSVGMIIGATIYPYLSRKFSKRLIIIIGGYSIGLFYFSFLFAGRFIRSAILMYIVVAVVAFVVGASISLLSSLCSVEFIKNVKEEYLARSSALFGAVCVAAMPVASFIVSAVAGFTSTAMLFAISGVLDIIVCIILCRKKLFIKIEKVRTDVMINEEARDSREDYGDRQEEYGDSQEDQLDGGSVYTPVSMD